MHNYALITMVKEFWRKAAPQSGGGRIFHKGQCNVTPPCRSIAVSCSSHSSGIVMILWRTEWSLCCIHSSRDSQCFSMGWTIPTTALPVGDLYLGPTRVYHPFGISIGSPVFAGLTIVINRQTQSDHATRSVATARILCHACDAA